MGSKIEKTLYHRSLLLLILVILFVVIILSVSIFIYCTHHPIEFEGQDVEHPNVLLIVVDDLRPALGCYGDKRAVTPNIDQLAAKSVMFTNAYAQQALCGPSRISFLTGLRPDTLRIYDDTGRPWRDSVHDFDAWNFTTLPQHFKWNGYETVSIGKVFPHGSVSNNTADYPHSWSDVPFHPEYLDEAELCPTDNGFVRNLLCPVKENIQNLPDIQVADYAVRYLHNKSDGLGKNVPFFMGIGFYKPHIPFKIPSEYLDLHPIDMIRLAPDNTKPLEMPEVSWNPWYELRSKEDVASLNISWPYGSIPENFQKRIRQAYYASTSYIDDQVGKILEALETYNYASNTIVVFLSDHGFSLGEHGEWDKFSNFDVSLKVPLLVHVPGLTEGVKDRKKFTRVSVTRIQPKNYFPVSPRYVASEWVELVDLFPTLAETANIAIPPFCPANSKPTEFCSEGVSFFPVIFDHVYPSMDFSWKTAVFAQCPRPSRTPKNNSDQPLLHNIKIMGYTLKYENYRYTRWVRFNNWNLKSHWGTFEDHELYDNGGNHAEMANLVTYSNQSNRVISLFKKLKGGWRKALPYAVYS